MSFLIAYDIKDNKRLRKIAKYTENKALRIQLSLYLLENIIKEKRKQKGHFLLTESQLVMNMKTRILDYIFHVIMD